MGEVWLDVLRRKMPGIWAFPVENAPGLPCKIIRLFIPMTDYRTAPTIIRTYVLFQGIIVFR